MEENKEKTVKKRQECDPAYQWHIQDLYASDEAWEKDYESLTSEIQSLAAYEGRLKEGSEVAREVAQQTLHEVKDAMKINYFDDIELLNQQIDKYKEVK